MLMGSGGGGGAVLLLLRAVLMLWGLLRAPERQGPAMLRRHSESARVSTTIATLTPASNKNQWRFSKMQHRLSTLHLTGALVAG